MRVIIFLSFSATLAAQSRAENFVDSTVNKLKMQSKTDNNDFRVFYILESFYNEALQSDEGELSQTTVQKINGYAKDGRIKNKHLQRYF
jgi:hypothetical protein